MADEETESGKAAQTQIGPKADGLDRMMERYQKSLKASGLDRVMERYQRSLKSSGLDREMERYQKSLKDSGLDRVMERYQKSLQASGLDREMERYQKSLKDSGLDRVMERYQKSLKASGSERVMKQSREVLAGIDMQLPEWFQQTVGAIISELQTRQLDGNDQVGLPVQLQGAATISVSTSTEGSISTWTDGRVAKPESPAWSALPAVVLFLLLQLLFAWGNLVASWEGARQGLVDLNARLPQTEILSDLRKFIRTELAGKPGDFRIVTGSDVRLRAGPSMKSEVLLLIPRQAVVVVLGKEDRTWRYVSYEHEGYVVEGYVSARFLKKVKR